jgi:hypothetical protein
MGRFPNEVQVVINIMHPKGVNSALRKHPALSDDGTLPRVVQEPAVGGSSHLHNKQRVPEFLRSCSCNSSNSPNSR